LWAYLVRRRREFVNRLGKRFHRGEVVERKIPRKIRKQTVLLAGVPELAEKSQTLTHNSTHTNTRTEAGLATLTPLNANAAINANIEMLGKLDSDSDSSEDDNGEHMPTSMMVTEEQVRSFISGGPQHEDPLAVKIGLLEEKSKEAKRLKEWQFKNRMCNLNCLTTWSSMVTDTRPKDMLAAYLTMVVQTREIRHESLASLSLQFIDPLC